MLSIAVKREADDKASVSHAAEVLFFFIKKTLYLSILSRITKSEYFRWVNTHISVKTADIMLICNYNCLYRHIGIMLAL